jgi:glycosyltransferase involved in cell wall biosynthesis
LIVNTRGLTRFHGTELLIQVFAQLAVRDPGLKFIIAGGGPEIAKAQKLVLELGLQDHVQFTGQIAERSMADLLDRADLMVNTSSFDNTPNALLEAFAAGVPVVTSDAGGIPDMVGDNARGYLVRDRTANSFVAAIDRCVENPEQTLLKVYAAHDWVKSFYWENLRRSYLDTFVAPFRMRGTMDLCPPRSRRLSAG